MSLRRFLKTVSDVADVTFCGSGRVFCSPVKRRRSEMVERQVRRTASDDDEAGSYKPNIPSQLMTYFFILS